MLLTMLITGAAFSQKLGAAKVPAAVKEGFKKLHPHAVASWEREAGNYEASFKEEGKSMSCVIDKQGHILETESAIPASELPAAAKAYVNKNYKGKAWKETAKIVKSNGEVNYEINVAGKDVLFDANGNHL